MSRDFNRDFNRTDWLFRIIFTIVVLGILAWGYMIIFIINKALTEESCITFNGKPYCIFFGKKPAESELLPATLPKPIRSKYVLRFSPEEVSSMDSNL